MSFINKRKQVKELARRGRLPKVIREMDPETGEEFDVTPENIDFDETVVDDSMEDSKAPLRDKYSPFRGGKLENKKIKSNVKKLSEKQFRKFIRQLLISEMKKNKSNVVKIDGKSIKNMIKTMLGEMDTSGLAVPLGFVDNNSNQKKGVKGIKKKKRKSGIKTESYESPYAENDEYTDELETQLISAQTKQTSKRADILNSKNKRKFVANIIKEMDKKIINSDDDYIQMSSMLQSLMMEDFEQFSSDKEFDLFDENNYSHRFANFEEY